MSFEFCVQEVRVLQNTALVSGYVNAGVVRLGSRFTTAFTMRWRRECEGMVSDPPSDIRSIDVCVHSIVSYQRTFQVLEEGVTGYLTVSGSDLELIKPDDHLVG
jgi:hypothetical protein